MKRFFSTQNRFTTLLLWGLVLVMAGLVYNAYRSNELSPFAGWVIGLVSVFILWVLLDTRYVLRNNFLFQNKPGERLYNPKKKSLESSIWQLAP